MKLYYEEEDKTVHLDESDLYFLGKQLLNLVHLYRTEVVCKDKKEFESLDVLTTIGSMLINRQYDQLLNDPSIIQRDVLDSLSDNWYLDATRL